MRRAERLGRGSLALDAAFCAAVGVVLVGARRRVARLLGSRPAPTALTGAATVGWAAIVGSQALRADWRTAVGRIAAANLAATLALIAGASVHPRRRARFILSGTAIDVAIFAVIQLAALILRDDPAEDRAEG